MPDVLAKGGFFIWVILFEAVVGLYFILERTIYFSIFLRYCRRGMATIKSTEDIGKIRFRNRTIEILMKAAEEKRANRELIELTAEKDLQDAERGLTTLSVIAQTAPLFGLLGTITGLIRVFITIQSLGESVSPSDLAGGIWEALLTTAAGLIVGIPTLIVYNYFVSRLVHYERDIFITISRLIDDFRRKGYEVI